MNLIAAVESLSDVVRQSRWGRIEEGVSYFDDLTLNVHILYDDSMVLPEPDDAVPDVLHQEEVTAFIALDRALGPMLRDLRDMPDYAYTGDPRWSRVVDAAAKELAVLVQSDQGAAP